MFLVLSSLPRPYRSSIPFTLDVLCYRRGHLQHLHSFPTRRSSDLPQLRDENAHNDKSVHGVLNPTYQAGLRRDAVQPDIEAERKKRDEIEAGKSYCSRRFGGATCDDKSAQIYARFDKND